MVKDETMETEAVFKDNQKKSKEKRIIWTKVSYCIYCVLTFLKQFFFHLI